MKSIFFSLSFKQKDPTISILSVFFFAKKEDTFLSWVPGLCGCCGKVLAFPLVSVLFEPFISGCELTSGNHEYQKNGDLSAPQQSKWLLQPAGFSGQLWMMAEPGGTVAISYLLERRGPDTSACWMLPCDEGSHDGICTFYLQRAESSRARKERLKALGITSRWLNSLVCSSFLPLYAAEFELRTAFLASRIGGSE